MSLHSNTYQVEDILVGRRVELVFDPFDLTRIQVRYQGRAMGVAVPYRIARHSHPRARPESDLAGSEPAPPAATGINYLDLIVTAHEEQLQAGVNYAAMSTETQADDPVEPDTVDLQLQTELDDFAAYLASHRQSQARTELPPEQDQTELDPAEQIPEQIPGQLDLTELLGSPEPGTEPNAGPDDEDEDEA